jgi:5'-AMP-activated protein kinase catalytic alpha subunit
MNPWMGLTVPKVLLVHVVDIWACGVVLFYMLCGYLPYDCVDEETVHELHQKIIKGTYHYPSGIHSVCKDLIDGILAKDPYKRLNAEEILKHPWSSSMIDSKPISSIVTYQHSKDSVGEEEQEVLIPCETTMMPFLCQMYQEELEKDLEDLTLIEEMEFEEKPNVYYNN